MNYKRERRDHMKRKFLPLLLCLSMLLTFIPVAQAASYTYSLDKSTQILNIIGSTYSNALRSAVADLFYDSDYSDLLSNKETLRSYETMGNVKAFPITNADSYGYSVVDRGQTVKFGWGGKGCFAYTLFVSASIYGTKGTAGTAITLNKNNTDNLKDLIVRTAQPGEHMRVDNKHSVSFLALGTENGKEGFYIAEYWGGGKWNGSGYNYSTYNDQYYIRFYTYEDFASKYNGYNFFIYDAYETSDYADLTPEQTPTPSQITRDVVLVLDGSGSMYGSKMENTETAAKKFVDQILAASSTTKIAVVSYGDYSETLAPLTDDAGVLYSAIEECYNDGVTNMHSGLSRAGSILEAGSGDKKAIVVMTDGAANEGAYGSSGDITTELGETFYVSNYGRPVYDLAQDYKNNKGYAIYSLGFGLSENSTAYNLIKHISSYNAANERYFWSVTDDNLEDIVFTFEDIADTISTKRSIVIVIECPVDVSISLDGETLDKHNLTASFGKLKLDGTENDYKYSFTLEDNRDYDVRISGTDTGTMDFDIAYSKGDTTQHRTFCGVPITPETEITTTATDYRADFALYVDEDGDGQIDEGWFAGPDQIATQEDERIQKELNPTADMEYTQDDEDSEEPEEPEDDPDDDPVKIPWPILIGTGGKDYDDVSRSDWFYDDVDYVSDHGLMNGTSDDLFSPNANTSRAMVVTILYRMAGEPYVYGGSGFADVADGQWYTDAVIWAAKNDIVDGYGNGCFGPNDSVTREQLAAILYRYAQFCGSNVRASADLTGYADGASISAWARPAMEWANAEGLINGRTPTTVAPQATASRAELAAILHRFCKKVK